LARGSRAPYPQLPPVRGQQDLISRCNLFDGALSCNDAVSHMYGQKHEPDAVFFTSPLAGCR